MEQRIDRKPRPAEGAMVAHKLDPLTASLADLVAAMEQRLHGRFIRVPLPEGRVMVGLEMPDNFDRIGAVGDTTEDAVAALAKRLETWPNA